MSMLSRFATLGGQPGDPYWANVSFLLVGNGVNNTTTNIVDSSSIHNTISINGNTTISTIISPPAISGSGSGTVYFDGNGDYLSVASNSSFAFPNNFTIEAWVNISSFTSNPVLIDTRNSPSSTTGLAIIFNSSGKATVYVNNTFAITSTPTYTTGIWYHVAVVRSVSTITLYINGQSVGSYTYSASLTDTSLGIGSLTSYDPGSVYKMNGYIYDLRITKGVARYTASYTPPPFPPTAAFPTY